MANPIAFQPRPVDPRVELQKRLDAAPLEHAEAVLVAWDLLQSAHEEGILDLLNGLVSAKDKIAGTLAEYAKLPEGVAGLRNLLALFKLLMSVDPELLDGIARALAATSEEHSAEQKTPGLFQLARRATSEDSRRSLSFVTLLLANVGRELKP